MTGSAPIARLERALRLDPARTEVRRQLVDLAMSLEWYFAARIHLRFLLDSGRSVGDPQGGRPGAGEGELEYLLGICAEGLHDDTTAAQHYQKAISLAPESPDVYVRLAGLLRNRFRDAQRADRVMDAREVKDGLIAANRQSFRAYLARGLYRKQYRIEGSDADVGEALRLAPGEADVRLAAAGLDVERGNLEAARRHLTTGLELHHQDARILTALAWLDKKSGHLNETEELLRRGADASTDGEQRGRFLWLLADTLIDGGKWAEAKAVIGSLDREPVRPELLGYLDARIGVGESRWEQARRRLEAIYPFLGAEDDLAYQANLLIGLCSERLGDLDQREAAFRRAVALDPQRIEGRMGLAAAKEAMGKLDEAVDEYRMVTERAPALGLALARLLILRNLRRPPGQRDWPGVEQALDRTARATPRSPGVIVVRAEALLGQGQPGRARDLLQAARDEQPDQVELWTALALMADRHETTESALAILQQAESRLGHRIELALARIQCWAERGDRHAPCAGRDRARGGEPVRGGPRTAAFEPVRRVAPGRRGPVSRSDPGAVGAATSAGPDPVLRAIRAGAPGRRWRGDAPHPGAAPGHRGRPANSGESGGALWRCGRARYLLWSSRDRGRGAIEPALIHEVRALLTEAGSQRPQWPLVPLVAAEAEDLAGNPQGSLRICLRAMESGTASPLVVRRTIQLLLDLRRFEQADGLIRKWREQGVILGDPRLQRLAAEVSLRVNDPARALELARQSIAPESKDYRDRLWLGQFYWAAGETGKAEPELRRAVELGSCAPETWVTLVRFLARTGSGDAARAVIEQAPPPARRRPSGCGAGSMLRRGRRHGPGSHPVPAGPGREAR